MKTTQGENEVDLGFKLAQPGTYIWQFIDGIQVGTNENTGKQSLRLPMQVDSVVQGDEDSVGRQGTLFIIKDVDFSEAILQSILTMTGMIDNVAKKFGDDVDIYDQTFVDTLNLKLQGKLVQITHEFRKFNDRNQYDWKKIEKVGANPAAAQPAASSGGAADEDW